MIYFAYINVFYKLDVCKVSSVFLLLKVFSGKLFLQPYV